MRLCNQIDCLQLAHGIWLLCTTLLWILPTSSLSAQNFLPDAPVKGFELPYFEPRSNFLSMKLRGEEGLIQADHTVQIRNLTMLFYEKGNADQAHTTVTSSTAVITPDTAQVSGQQDLHVVSPEFTLQGKQWVWDWKQNRLLIQQGVQLQLKQQLAPILQ